MTNYYSTTADITGPPVGTGSANLITTAYDKMVGFALRSEPQFRALISKRPADVSHAGSVVRLQKYADLTAVSSALTENVDPDSVAIGNTSYVDITLAEYGNSVLTTEKLALESLSAIDPAVANLVAFNMRDSLDSLVQTVMRGNLRRVKNIAGTLTAVTDGTATVSGIQDHVCLCSLRGVEAACSVGADDWWQVRRVRSPRCFARSSCRDGCCGLARCSQLLRCYGSVGW